MPGLKSTASSKEEPLPADATGTNIAVKGSKGVTKGREAWTLVPTARSVFEARMPEGACLQVEARAGRPGQLVFRGLGKCPKVDL